MHVVPLLFAAHAAERTPKSTPVTARFNFARREGHAQGAGWELNAVHISLDAFKFQLSHVVGLRGAAKKRRASWHRVPKKDWAPACKAAVAVS